MLPTQQGAFRLFTASGIAVYLHWSWLVCAYFIIDWRRDEYSSLTWNAVEYVALFVIVLLHEFGHAFACRQVGGQANRIVLWPLGGVAYVAPPPRPGAQLWSIAAGPLVNVALIPVFYALAMFSRSVGWPETMPDVHALVRAMAFINLALLIFNLLPIYPLDGGQILRSLLWFGLGPLRSLQIAAGAGFVGAAALVALALYMRSILTGLVAVLIFQNCWSRWREARDALAFTRAPLREGVACPVCQNAPQRGAFWACLKCQAPFDIFETRAVCPRCQAHHAETQCLRCGTWSPAEEWERASRV